MKKAIVIGMFLTALAIGGTSVSAAPQNTDVQTSLGARGICAVQGIACPNDGSPALDGTGYRGGNGSWTIDESICIGCPAGNCSGAALCPYPECPCQNCPNDGVPARDGTGYRAGRGQGQGNGGCMRGTSF